MYSAVIPAGFPITALSERRGPNKYAQPHDYNSLNMPAASVIRTPVRRGFWLTDSSSVPHTLFQWSTISQVMRRIRHVVAYLIVSFFLFYILFSAVEDSLHQVLDYFFALPDFSHYQELRTLNHHEFPTSL